jgi:hypothetical protein
VALPVDGAAALTVTPGDPLGTGVVAAAVQIFPPTVHAVDPAWTVQFCDAKEQVEPQAPDSVPPSALQKSHCDVVEHQVPPKILQLTEASVFHDPKQD